MDGTKHEIRRQMLCRRRALSASEVDAAERAALPHVVSLAAYREASSVLAYLAVDGELATARLIAAAFADQKRVFLPRLAGAGMVFAEHRDGGALAIGRFGIPEPLGRAGSEWNAAAGSAVVFLPLVAWDGEGVRLGRGGGFYDRALATVRENVRLVGLGYAFQQCAKIPRDPWDVTLDFVVGERGPVRCGNGDDRSPVRKEDTRQHDNRTDGGGQHRAGRRTGAGDWTTCAGGRAQEQAQATQETARPGSRGSPQGSRSGSERRRSSRDKEAIIQAKGEFEKEIQGSSGGRSSRPRNGSPRRRRTSTGSIDQIERREAELKKREQSFKDRENSSRIASSR